MHLNQNSECQITNLLVESPRGAKCRIHAALFLNLKKSAVSHEVAPTYIRLERQNIKYKLLL